MIRMSDSVGLPLLLLTANLFNFVSEYVAHKDMMVESQPGVCGEFVSFRHVPPGAYTDYGYLGIGQ